MTGFALGMGNKKILLISFMLAVGMIAFPVAKSGYYFIRGLVALRGGFESEAVKHLEKSIKANPNFIEAYMLFALAYAEWGSSSKHYLKHDEEGLVKLKSETLDRAEDVLKAALARFPFYKDRIQYMLARIYDEDARNSGYVWDKDKAIQGYTQLVSEYPNSKYAQRVRERIEVLSR